MTLIKSVSGIRGTIGGTPGDNLTPPDIVSFAAAYATWLQEEHDQPTVVVGRDGRLSGMHVQSLVTQTLLAMGVDVIDVGLSTTPSVEMYVVGESAQGGIIITASHNPRHWNALKFLNAKGEFISKEIGERILALSSNASFTFSEIDQTGKLTFTDQSIKHHVDAILQLDLVDADAIEQNGFHIIVDCVNSTGAISIPPLLDALGCSYTLLNADVTGEFAHNPEPLEGHLQELMQKVRDEDADMGIAVDPDVDRLAFVSNDGSYFGEEYTLVAIADYVLANNPGNTVSNLSSTQALKDITLRHGQSYAASKVGEVHVVTLMKETNAIIGGEGNGGIIYPALHYGRDALVGIALMLTSMAKNDKTLVEIRSDLPDYAISKNKINLEKGVDPDVILEAAKRHYAHADTDIQDGIKIILPGQWIHLRKSNTEPIIRIYTESKTIEQADQLARDTIALLAAAIEQTDQT